MKKFWLVGALLCLPVCALADGHERAARAHIDRVARAVRWAIDDPSSVAANAELGEATMALINDRSPAGDKALAALAGHYLGESQELECEILARGKRLIPALNRFSREPISLGLRVNPSDTPESLVEQIRRGEQCE